MSPSNSITPWTPRNRWISLLDSRLRGSRQCARGSKRPQNLGSQEAAASPLLSGNVPPEPSLGLGRQVPSPRPLELFHIPRRVSAGRGSAFRHRAGLRAAGFGPGPVLCLILGDGSGLDAARHRGRRSLRHAGELAGAFSSIWWLNIYEVGEQTKHRESKETEPDTCSC